jgi:transposase, IS30 family
MHTKLTKTERVLLSEWLKQKIAKKECTRRLKRDIKTIRREIRINSVRVGVGKNDWQIIYEPLHAQRAAEERRQHAYQAKQPLKNKEIYAYVLEHLRYGWSPEQIAGRLKYLHPHNKSWHICHETIYQFIYKPKTDLPAQEVTKRQGLDKRQVKNQTAITVTNYDRPLWEYLRRKQTKRRKRSGRIVHRVRIPDRVSIHDRPKAIAKRKQFGHWEGDSIVGKGHTSGLHTEYERVSSLTKIAKMARVDSHSFLKATKKIFGRLPNPARLSTTLDNGPEHTDHYILKEKHNMAVYFADTYSAWQRGGNENANLWIRYYFPKGTDFSTITAEEIKDVEWELNNRPRKRLEFKTPQEVFNKYLNKP